MKRTLVWSVLVVRTHLSSQPRAQSADAMAGRLSGMSRLVTHPQRLADSTTRQGAIGVTSMTLRVDTAELTTPVVETLFVWERVTK